MAKSKDKAAKAPAKDPAAAPASPIPETETRPVVAEETRSDTPAADRIDAIAEDIADTAGRLIEATGGVADTDGEPSDDANPRFSPPDYPDDSKPNCAEYRVIGSPIFEGGRQYQPGQFITLTTERARQLGAALLEGPFPV